MEPRQVCDRCGGDALRPATHRERLTHWFTNGAGGGPVWHCLRCGVSRAAGSSYLLSYQAPRSGWGRRVRLPLDLLAAVRRARRWHPLPPFYAAVGGIALVPAAAVAALTPARWSVAVVGGPIAAMFGAFLWSLATVAGQGRRDVLWELAPGRAQRRDLEDDIAGVRSQIGNYNLLVPHGWAGGLSIEGLSWANPPRGSRVLQEVLVVADQGDPMLDPERHVPGWRPPAPRIEIRCSNQDWDVAEEQALVEFVERVMSAPAADLDGSEQDHGDVDRQMLEAQQADLQQRQRWESDLNGRWRDGSIEVDGVAIPARLLTHEDVDIAIATFVFEGQPTMVVTTGIELDGLALVALADPSPVVEEFEVRRRRMFTP